MAEQAQLEMMQGKKVDTKYLLGRLMSYTDRIEMAKVLVELADRADRSEYLQEVLHKIKLPPPMNMFEYRKPSTNRKGFWARIPHTRYNPSAGEIKARIIFSKIAYNLYGTMGTVERPDGTRIARLNYLQGEIMRGMKIVSDEEMEYIKKQKAIERIARQAN